jgi:hypothetical protein
MAAGFALLESQFVFLATGPKFPTVSVDFREWFIIAAHL